MKKQTCLGLWFLLGFGIFASLGVAESRGSKKSWTLDLGAYVSNVQQRLDAADGYAGKVSTLQGALGIRRHLPLGGALGFEPGLFTLLPWRSGADGSAKVFTTQLTLPFALHFSQVFALKLGPGLMWEWMTSTLEAVSQNNGTGLSTFYLPSRSTHILYVTANAGLAIAFSQRLSLNLNAIVVQVMSTERRRYHGLATLGWTL